MQEVLPPKFSYEGTESIKKCTCILCFGFINIEGREITSHNTLRLITHSDMLTLVME
jgi:hypothetical protein